MPASASCCTALNARPMKGYGGRIAARSLRAVRSAGAAAVAGRALRPCRLAPGARQHRLPRRGRSPLLLGAVSADSRRRSTCASRPRRSRSFSAARAIWVHARSFVPGRHTTVPEHMPKAHRAHLEWSPVAARSAGAPRSARRPRRSSSRFSRAARIPSRAIAPVSGCCASRSSTARSG